MKEKNLSFKWSVTDESSIYSVGISNDGNIVGSALANGKISIRSLNTGRLSFELTHSDEGFPITGIKFNPVKTNSFITVSSDGSIKEWGSKQTKNVWSDINNKAPLNTIDIEPNSKYFAVAGNDSSILLFDYTFKQCLHSFSRSISDVLVVSGHSERVFSVVFNKEDPNIMLSGGWDNNVIVWDIRNKAPVISFFGPHVCGESIDISGHRIVTGSWRTNDQIQVFDIRTAKLLNSTKWNIYNNDQCMINFLKVLPNKNSFVAGGSGTNEMRVFSLDTLKSLSSPITFKSKPFSLAVAKDSRCVVGTDFGELQLFSF